MTEQNDAAAATPTQKPQFALQRIYTKDISFESPGSPHSFMVEWTPETKVQFNSAGARLADKQYEVVLMINVVTMNGDKVAYIAEVKMAGVFLIEAPEAQVELLLGAHCPSILFPYAREVISDLVSRGSFPQMLLQPINFDAIYAEARRRRDQADSDEAAKH